MPTISLYFQGGLVRESGRFLSNVYNSIVASPKNQGGIEICAAMHTKNHTIFREPPWESGRLGISGIRMLITKIMCTCMYTIQCSYELCKLLIRTFIFLTSLPFMHYWYIHVLTTWLLLELILFNKGQNLWVKSISPLCIQALKT